MLKKKIMSRGGGDMKTKKATRNIRLYMQNREGREVKTINKGIDLTFFSKAWFLTKKILQINFPTWKLSVYLTYNIHCAFIHGRGGPLDLICYHSIFFSSARRCKIKSRFAQNYAPRLCWEQCIGERFCLSAHSILFSLDAIFTRLRALFWAVGCTHAFSWAVLECAAWDTV